VESNLTEDVALDENEEVAFDEVDDAKVVLLEDADSETAEEIVAEDAGTEEAEDEDAEIDEVSEAADLEAEEAGSEDSEVADVENEDVDAVDAETDEVDAEATEAVEADDAGAVEVDIEAETEEVEAEEIDIEEEVSIANELAVVKNGWEKQSDGTYKYYENGTALTYTVKKIGNDYFGFDDNGIMYDDEEFEIYDGNDVWYRAKKGGYLYVNSWYVDNWGNKYYYGAGGGTNVGDTVLKIDGVNYLFYNGGALFIYGSAEINGVTYVSDKDGKAYALKKNGWTKVGEDWYYLDKNGSYNSYSVFRDGGKYYFWMDDGRVLCNDYTFSDGYAYRAKDDCSLFVNEWYISEYGSKYYYGAEGKASTNDCVQTIGGKQYLFEGYGQLNINGTSTIDGVIYISDAFGIATKASQNGWCKCGDYWYYFENGSKITSKVKKIGSFYFGFDYNGHMYANRLFSMNRYNANGTYIGTGYYYADSEGHLYINKWRQYGGEWFYYGADGARVSGWQTIAGTRYFFNPGYDGNMLRSCYVMDGNDIYRLGSDGAAKKVTNPNNLFYDVYERFAVYYDNGTRVRNTWKEINKKWFYFDSSGSPIHGDVRNIKNIYYAFNTDGTMATTGWVKLNGYTYYVKNEKGYLATGEQQIGDKYYYFENNGRMRTGIINYNNKIYFLNPDGSWAATAKEGWNSVQGTWYYVKDGELVCGQELELADGTYYFNYYGAMVKNEVVNQKYYGADGKQVTKTGWYKVDTKWIYIQNGSMLYDGVKTINKTEYAFDYQGFMVSNSWYEGVYYNADGIAVKKSTKDGWQLYGGKYYYYKNGSLVRNAWVGDYYIGSEGYMLRNTETPDNYYVGNDGKYVKNTVINGIVVKSNGKIASNEFVTIGGKKYYATRYGHTCNYEAYVIGNNLYQFKYTNVNGYSVTEYVKTIATNVQNNKWYQFGNQWAYVRDGQVILNGIAEIGGANYYFSNGVMITDVLTEASTSSNYYYDYDNGRVTNFGSDGKEVKNRSGWVGGFYYGADHKTSFGWVQVNGKLYHGYSDPGRSEYEVINGRIYQFDTKTGAFKNEVYKYNGWLQVGSDWYYFENGTAVRDAKTIGKATYAFDYDGRMLKNSILYSNNGDRYYVNSEGIIDTTSGFRTVNGQQIYIDKDGKVAMGIRVINGKTYYFECSDYEYY
jgi:glucan-binding YG repeat protein